MSENEILKRYLDSLSNTERIAKSRDIRETLGISWYVLSDWKTGRTKIHPVFIDKISEIVGVDIRKYVENK